MKKSQAVLDLKNDSILLFGKRHPLLCTNFDHYYIPLSKNKFEIEEAVNTYQINFVICLLPIEMKKRLSNYIISFVIVEQRN